MGKYLYNIGVCTLKLSNYEAALMYFKQSLKTYNESKIYFNIAFCYAMIKNYKKALLYYNKAWALDNEDDDCRKAIEIVLKKIKAVQ